MDTILAFAPYPIKMTSPVAYANSKVMYSYLPSEGHIKRVHFPCSFGEASPESRFTPAGLLPHPHGIYMRISTINREPERTANNDQKARAKKRRMPHHPVQAYRGQHAVDNPCQSGTEDT